MLSSCIEMFRFDLIVGVACAILLMAATVSAKVVRVTAFGPKGRVQVVTPLDGHSLVAIFSPRVPGLLNKLRANVDKSTVVSVQRVGYRDEEIKILFPSPIRRYSVNRLGKKVQIDIDYRTREENLRDRIMETLKVPVPSTFVGFRFDAGERLMRAGRFSDALSRFKKLSERYELRAWAQLRLSDIALLSGDVRGACRRYASTSESFGVRISGMLARLRLQVLGCGWRKGPQADWDVLISRADRVPGKIGTFLREEAIWAMRQVSRPNEVDLALRLVADLQLSQRRLRKRLYAATQVLVARAVRLAGDPVDTARMCYRHKDQIDAHSEAYSLRYVCAKAFRELSLVNEAVAELKELKDARNRNFSGALWRLRRGNSQATYTLAEVYNDMGDADYVYATLVDYEKRFGFPPPAKIDGEPAYPKIDPKKIKVGKMISLLDGRLYRLGRAVRASVPVESGTKSGRRP